MDAIPAHGRRVAAKSCSQRQEFAAGYCQDASLGTSTNAEFRNLGLALVMRCVMGINYEADRVRKKTFKDVEVEEAACQLEIMHRLNDVDPMRKVDWTVGSSGDCWAL